jgi:DNA topoisomerase-1
MGKSLVIVESPAKARTINKYLGRDYVVKSSVGHIRDLPVSGSGRAVDPKERAKAAAETRKLPAAKREKHKKERARRALFARMGIDPEEGWSARYEILPGKEKVVSELRQLAKSADTVYLATDLDREGEAIAWHLREVIGGDASRFKRVVFNEITKTAIQQAFEDPGELDLSRVNAQQARRFLDRVVGYMLSPLLWSKLARGLSAGRVQSVAVRLIVEREREIRAFVPEEFWEVHADTRTKAREALRLEVAKQAGETFRPTNREATEAALALLRAADYEVVERKDKPTKTRPTAPFITSTLQQAASTRLGFSVKKTMMLAQRLYEAGHITYMRTDSTNLSSEAVGACRELIASRHGARYLPEAPLSYSSKQGAQEAHEAIRPSDVRVRPGSIPGLERDQQRMYELIWRQFVACQMVPAEYLSTNITVRAGDFELKTRGRILVFDGYTAVQPPSGRSGENDVPLPDVQVGERLELEQLDPRQHFTKPPPRYGEASLVKELEKRGIGRPSTYASIISTIQERGYVRLENRRFHAEKMGEIVTERLMESFEELMDYGFTAGLEEALDAVAVGDKDWKRVLGEFYEDFRKKLLAAESEEKGMRANAPTDTDIPCPSCGRPMQIRTASTGVFLGCSGYALPPKERCKTTLNLISGDEAVSVDEEEDDEGEARLLLKKRHCPICQTAMDAYLLPDQGLRGADTGMRSLRGGDAAALRSFREVLRVHERRLQEHPQAPAQRRARAAQGRSDSDAASALREMRRLLPATRRRGRHIPGGEPVPEASGDAGADGAGADRGEGSARSQVSLPGRCARHRSRGSPGARPLLAQDEGAVRHLRGGRQEHRLACHVPGREVGGGDPARPPGPDPKLRGAGRGKAPEEEGCGPDGHPAEEEGRQSGREQVEALAEVGSAEAQEEEGGHPEAEDGPERLDAAPVAFEAVADPHPIVYPPTA